MTQLTSMIPLSRAKNWVRISFADKYDVRIISDQTYLAKEKEQQNANASILKCDRKICTTEREKKGSPFSVFILGFIYGIHILHREKHIKAYEKLDLNFRDVIE